MCKMKQIHFDNVFDYEDELERIEQEFPDVQKILCEDCDQKFCRADMATDFCCNACQKKKRVQTSFGRYYELSPQWFRDAHEDSVCF